MKNYLKISYVHNTILYSRFDIAQDVLVTRKIIETKKVVEYLRPSGNRLKMGWTNFFRSAVESSFDVCPINFDGHYAKKQNSRKSSGLFLSISGHCTFEGI